MTDIPFIDLNQGSSVAFTGTWPDGAGGGANMTGYDIVPYDVHPALAGHLVLAFASAAAGTFTGRIDWQPDMPAGMVMHFRILVQPQAGFPALLPSSTPQCFVKVI